MTRGRKKKNYRTGRTTLSISDMDALNICKSKKINISEKITWFLQGLAYMNDPNNLDQTEAVLLAEMNGLDIARQKKIEEVQCFFEAKMRVRAKQLRRIQDLKAKKLLKEMIIIQDNP